MSRQEPTADRPRVAIAHDYLTQRGGAERVVLALHRAFPDATIHTTLYDPEGTYPEFRDAHVVVSPIDRSGPLRRDHRSALPLLPYAVSRLRVDADVVVVSRLGVGARRADDGAQGSSTATPRRAGSTRPTPTSGTRPAGPRRRASWVCSAGGCVAGTGVPRRPPTATSRIRRSSANASRRHTASTPTCSPRPTASTRPTRRRRWPRSPTGPTTATCSSCHGCCRTRTSTSRSTPCATSPSGSSSSAPVPSRRGCGPRLRTTSASSRACRTPSLRWTYAHARTLLAPSLEDFGLTPLEAAAFGLPTVALHAGGYLDTIDERVNGTFFEEPTVPAIRAALVAARERAWDAAAIRAHAERFSEARFCERIRAEVDSLLSVRRRRAPRGARQRRVPRRRG